MLGVKIKLIMKDLDLFAFNFGSFESLNEIDVIDGRTLGCRKPVKNTILDLFEFSLHFCIGHYECAPGFLEIWPLLHHHQGQHLVG